MASFHKSPMHHTSMMKKVFHAFTTSTILLSTLLQESSALRLKTSGLPGEATTPEDETQKSEDVISTRVEHVVITERGQEAWDNPRGEVKKIGQNFYWILKKEKLGEGAFGKVYKAVRVVKKEDSTTKSDDVNSNIPDDRHKEFEPVGDVVVVKVLDWSADVEREIEIHGKLDHPNVVRLHDHEIDVENGAGTATKKAYLAMEFAGEKELYDFATDQKNPLSHHEIRDIMRQIFGAVAYLHEQQGLAHRDIKLENIMVTEITREQEGTGNTFFQKLGLICTPFLTQTKSKRKLAVKLIDFGTAKGAQHGLKTPIGTPHYAPPEVLKTADDDTEYTKQCDLWSCGVVSFILLTGRMPFDAPSKPELYRKIQAANFRFRAPRPGREEVPDAAKKLIQALLQVNPKNRPSASEVLQHEFLTGN